MISKSDIEYELEEQENITVEDLRKAYWGSVVMWITGSGSSPNSDGKYKAILQYKENVEYHEGTIKGTTANQAYIHGALEMTKKITKPVHIYLIVPLALGVEKAFRNTGTNAALIQSFIEEVHNRGCTLTEVRFINGANQIKSFIIENSGNSELQRIDSQKAKKTEVFRLRYKQVVYNECLAKVIDILNNAEVDQKIIDKILHIQAE